MYIYRHHTAGDVIDLDDQTGLWSPFPEDRERIPTGLMTLTQRADDPIRGSYTIENEKRCCFYWAGNGEVVFRTSDDRRLCLFRRESGGMLIDLMPDVIANLQPTEYGDGRAMADMSTFSLIDIAGRKLFEISYNSARYLQYYLGNFTFTPDEDLSDWDFFVAVKRTIEELKQISRAWVAISAGNLKKTEPAPEVLMTETGMACPRTGLWIPIRHLNMRDELSAGEQMPDVGGNRETWVWVGVGQN